MSWSTLHRRRFRRLARRIGMIVRLHDLRHTFTSHWVMSGPPLPVVQELLGHAHISTTMIYSHLAPNIHRREVERLEF
ncbi:MAG: tyrosine-type recombinase/integrase [Candidatus Zixiibacteriota bacterium]|nr:MAG: tyrosine-type recombinase/integrase [candidate division Zixibacteria bacterium]